MAGKLVVFGSLNLDLVLPVGTLPAPGQTVLGGDLRRYPGGKGANQAVAAAKLAGATDQAAGAGRAADQAGGAAQPPGALVRLVGRVGADAEGAFLLAEAAAAGVDVSGVLADAGTTTGHALILVDGRGENIIAVGPGANARLDHTDAARAAGPLGPGDTLICQLEVPVPAVAVAVRAARAAGALVVLNAAPAVAVPTALLSDVDILVVNESEARAIGTADPAALAARTDCAVVVTLGGEGAAFASHDGGRAGSAPSYPVDVVDTTGAGDVFVAGLAVARHRGADLPEAVAFAVAAGALAVTAPGARGADLSAALVHHLMG